VHTFVLQILRIQTVSDYVYDMMSSSNAYNVAVRDHWGGVRTGRGNLGVGVGSIASTRDKCG
jgi:hypothetical protein